MATSVMLGKSEAFHISYGGRWELAFKLLKKKLLELIRHNKTGPFYCKIREGAPMSNDPPILYCAS